MKRFEISLPMPGYAAMEDEDTECKKVGTMLLEIRKTRSKFREPIYVKEKEEVTEIEDPVRENDDHVEEAEKTETDDHVEHFEDPVENALFEENVKHHINVIKKVNILMEPKKED